MHLSLPPSGGSLGRREIRLLFLVQNESGSDNISYNLVRTSLDDAPPYEALSYTWGDETCQIKLGSGTLTTMPTNLYHALRNLQRPHASRLLWIDSLCIDQSNDEERSHQVQLMRHIYATAWRVLIWLGEPDDNIVDSMEVLKHAARVRTDQSGFPKSASLTPEERHLIARLIDQPYFERVWVLQETMVARRALVIWGQWAMPFETLVAACENIDRSESLWTNLKFVCQNIADFGYLRRVFQGLTLDQSSLGLTELLIRMRGQNATDPRDKIFGLVGIAKQGDERTTLLPDYRRSVEELYTSVTRFLIGGDHSLQVLSTVQHAGANNALPSWVPDWRIQYFIRLLDSVESYLKFRVHGERRTFPVVTHLPDSTKLALGGFSFDVVMKVEDDACVDVELHNDQDRVLFYSLQDRGAIAAIIGCDDKYGPTHEDIEIAWLRTVSAGLFPDEERLQTSFAQSRYPQYVRWQLADKASSVPPREVASEILSYVPQWTKGRMIFVSQRGFIGLGPAEVETGDVVCILFGGNLPYVLRPIRHDNYTFLGPSYVHGIMNGEAYNGVEQTPHETFALV